ncbi:MAG TPA: hypothetical protein VF601_00390 [Beijerinckiaceae bacterium]|jgi:hypothetical protein
MAVVLIVLFLTSITLWFVLPPSRRWFRVLWVCRVSVVSALVGYLLLFGVDQAQDLFAETKWDTSNILRFCFALLFWVSAVHLAARLILGFRDWIPRDELYQFGLAKVRGLYFNAGVWVPRFLAWIAFAGVLMALYKTRMNLEPIAKSSIDILPSARNAIDGINQLTVYVWITLAIFSLLMFLRRPVLERITGTPKNESVLLRGDFKGKARSRTETLLRLATWSLIFFCAALVIYAVSEPFAVAESFSRAVFLMLALGIWVMPITIVASLSHRLRFPLIAVGVILAALISAYVPAVHDVRRLDKQAIGARQIDLTDAVARWRAENCPKELADCPSPIIMAAAGGASRAAFFTVTVLGTLLDQTQQEGGALRPISKQLFALSTVSGSSVGAVMARTAIADAAAKGKNSQAWLRGPCQAKPASDYGHFDDEQIRSWRRCLQALTIGDFLSPVAIGMGLRDLLFLAPFIGTEPWWKDRAYLLERSWERHYDHVVVGSAPKGDDEGRLAQPFGIERKFYGASPPAISEWSAGKADGAVAVGPSSAKWLPLLVINGTSVITGRRILTSELSPTWIPGAKCREGNAAKEPCPLFQESFDLFEVLGGPLNGDQANGGAAATGATARADLCGGAAGLPPAIRAPDVRLSTAATMSARFPLISPSGAIRNCEGKVGDRVIDGGYFENGGLVTAADLAEGLKKFGLEPVIVYVANDPVPLEEDAHRRPRGNLGPALPVEAGGEFLSDVLTPALGLYATRSGHLAEAARIATEKVYVQGEKTPHFFSFNIYDPLMDKPCPPKKDSNKKDLNEDSRAAQPCQSWTMEKISMSWWLSQPVQEYLDKQIQKHYRNQRSMESLLGILRTTCNKSQSSDCSPLCLDTSQPSQDTAGGGCPVLAASGRLPPREAAR